MLIPRIIPCLLLQDGGLVKTVKFKNPKYIGDPINAVKIFNDKEADELIFIDIDASKFNREPDYEVIKDIAQEAFMPLSYGGGIKNLIQIEKVLRVGVEKVVINSASLTGYDLIRNAAKEFGNSTIISAIDFKRSLFGKECVFNHVSSKTLKLNYFDHMKACEDAGAGELFINSVDRDGTFLGYDVKLLSELAEAVNIPVIACGGAGSVEQMVTLVKNTEISSSAAGSIFVFQGPHKAILIKYPERKLLEELFKSKK
ncbi:MAG: cyclase [Parvicella sp.]|jgi:cyclase